MKQKTFTLTMTALLTALLVLMTFTGIGYIPIGPFKLTMMTLPVAVGAAVCGPYTGLVLGLVFGLTSFATGLLGMDALGALLISFGWKTTLYLFLVCLIPRVLCGWLPALLHKLLCERNRLLADALTCAAVAILNTALFVTLFWLFFGGELQSDPRMMELLGGAIPSLWLLFAAFAGINGLIEVGVNLVVGTAITTALRPAVHRFH